MPKPSKQLAAYNKNALKQRKQLASSKKVDNIPKSPPKISRYEAATKIALAWRRKYRYFTTCKLVHKFISSGPTIERVKSLG
jgi:hypothetical protein